MKEKIEKIKIGKIIINADITPREEIDRTLVETYAENIDLLPPITLTKVEDDFVLLDGWHRLEAHKLKGIDEIAYILVDTKDDRERLEKATEANATYGKQLTNHEKKRVALKLYNGNPNYNKHLIKTLGIASSTYYKWVEDVAKEREIIFQYDVIQTYLKGEMTQEQVAEKYNIEQSTVSKIIKNLFSILKSENGIEKVDDDIKCKYRYIFEFKPYKNNIWAVNTVNSFDESDIYENEQALNTNLLYRYTKPFDTVYLQNETLMLDSCKKMLRRYFIGDEKANNIHLSLIDYSKDFQKDVAQIRKKIKEGHIVIRCHNLKEDTLVFNAMRNQGLSLKNRIVMPKVNSSFEDGYETLLVFEVKEHGTS